MEDGAGSRPSGHRRHHRRQARRLSIVIVLAGMFVAPLLLMAQANADYPPRPSVHRPVHAQDQDLPTTPVLQVPLLPAPAVPLPAPEPARSLLARTGADVIGEVTVALAVITVGVALLVLGRRRQRST
jgi:hypothetical protein